MKTAMNRSPVAVRHPVTEQFVTVARGMEFDDNDPIVTHPGHAWLFEEQENPGLVESVPVPQVEQATRRSGEVRRNRQR